MSEMPIMCEPSVVNTRLTRVRVVTFSERTHSLWQFKLQEKHRVWGERRVKDKTYPATFSAGHLSPYSSNPRLQSVRPVMETLTTTSHRDPDTTCVAGHPQDIPHCCCCASLPAAQGKRKWKCWIIYIKPRWLLKLPQAALWWIVIIWDA